MKRRLAPLTARHSQILTAQDGAAYVEFLIAFFPILLLFVGLLQLQVVYVTRLFVSRAAFAAARAAAVYIPQPDEQGQQTHRATESARAAIDEAVLLAVGPVLARGWLAGLPFAVFPASNDPSSEEEVTDFRERGMVRVRLFGHYVCHMPPLDLVMCEKRDGKRVVFMSADAVFPYQRADYQYDVEYKDEQPAERRGRRNPNE